MEKGIFPDNYVVLRPAIPPREPIPPSSRGWDGRRASTETVYQNIEIRQMTSGKNMHTHHCSVNVVPHADISRVK
jgi:hypothetical protein